MRLGGPGDALEGYPLDRPQTGLVPPVFVGREKKEPSAAGRPLRGDDRSAQRRHRQRDAANRSLGVEEGPDRAPVMERA
jgi:hypothetical protein